MLNTPGDITTNTKYIPALDGIRGLAILMVLGFHYLGQHAVFSKGWAGVDLFFVLSGYLITKRLMENKERSDRYAKFYKNRVLRIFPLYYLVLILLFSYALIKNEYFFEFKNAVAFFLFFQNWAFIIKGLSHEIFLPHTWSLAVEEQFYLVWPLVLYSFYKTKHFKSVLWLLLAAIPVARCISYFINPHYTPTYLYYFNTFYRIDTIIWGALIYFIVPKEHNFTLLKRAALISFALLMAGLFLFKNTRNTGPFFSTIGYTLIACIFTLVIYRTVNWPQCAIAVFFNNTFLRKIGKISYGLYLIHWPVLRIVKAQSKILAQNYFTVPSVFVSAFSIVISALLTYLISHISYYYYESYFLKQKK
jgi:peptidoglycan/LPS O-acetylase OafA/YrhL